MREQEKVRLALKCLTTSWTRTILKSFRKINDSKLKALLGKLEADSNTTQGQEWTSTPSVTISIIPGGSKTEMDWAKWKISKRGTRRRCNIFWCKKKGNKLINIRKWPNTEWITPKTPSQIMNREKQRWNLRYNRMCRLHFLYRKLLRNWIVKIKRWYTPINNGRSRQYYQKSWTIIQNWLRRNQARWCQGEDLQAYTSSSRIQNQN